MPYLRVVLKSLRKKAFDFEPQSLGEHIKRRRLMMGMTQEEAGERMGVTEFTVINWETGLRKPAVKHMPAIVRFVGYDPAPRLPVTIPERLAAKRRELGWSQKVAARRLGVDPCTWSSWEAGGTILLITHRRLIARFLGLSQVELLAAMRRQWNDAHSKRRVIDLPVGG